MDLLSAETHYHNVYIIMRQNKPQPVSDTLQLYLMTTLY